MSRHRRQQIFLDGIEMAIEMALIAYAQLRATIEYRTTTAESRPEEPPESSLATQMMMEAWSIVDSVNRLRVLIPHTPNLKKTPAIVSFLKSTEPVTTLRHFVQHLEEKALEVATTGKPIWGSLSWVWATPSDVHQGRLKISVYIPGRLAKAKGHPIVNPIGKDIETPVGLITLTAAETTVNLSEVIEVVERFKSRYEKALQNSNEGAAELLAIELDSQ